MVRMKRIRSDEDRARIARRKGGFDDSWITKKAMKRVGSTHKCYWCKKPLTFYEFNRNKGVVYLSCNTDGCPNNRGLKRSQWNPIYRKIFARHIDRKLIFDMKHLMIGRHPSRLWATRKNTIH